MMAEMLAARRESAHAMELLAQVIVASPIEAPVAMVGMGAMPMVSKGPVPTRTS
jgi:hypothetical protein